MILSLIAISAYENISKFHAVNYYIIFLMSSQNCPNNKLVTPNKSSHKSHAKFTRLRQFQHQLDSLYKSNSLSLTYDKVQLYLKCIELTQNIHQEIVRSNIALSYQNLSTKKSNKKRAPPLDVRDILSNNITFGIKLKHKKMVAGFAYVVARILREGLQSLGYYLNILKSVNANLNCFSAELQNIPETKQIELACQIRFFLKINEINEQKNEALIKKCLICLARILQEEQNNLIEQFYHWGFKQFKINNKLDLYLQFLVSYFNYLERRQKIPELDICRLTLDILMDGHLNDKNQNQLIGFLIRKCYFLIGQYYSQKKFLLEDQTMKQLSKTSIALRSNCEKSILVIYQCLFKIDRIDLVVKENQFLQIQFKDQIKCRRKSVTLGTDYEAQKACRFIASATLYLRKIKAKATVLTQQILRDCQVLKDKLSNNMHSIMNKNPSYIFIWDQLINQIHPIKAELIPKCSHKQILKHIQIIAQSSIFIEIQNTILTHPIHLQASKNHYLPYICTNTFLLIVRNLLRRPSEKFYAADFKKLIISLTLQLNDLKQIAYNQWDQLILLCLHYLKNYFHPRSKKKLQQLLEFSTVQRVTFLLKSLLRQKDILLMKKTDRQINYERQSNIIAHFCIFLAAPYSPEMAKQKLNQFLQIKFTLFLSLIEVIDQLILVKKDGLLFPYIDEILGLYLVIYTIFKPYCRIQHNAKIITQKNLIKNLSGLSSRLIQRQVYQKIVAQHLQFHSQQIQLKSSSKLSTSQEFCQKKQEISSKSYGSDIEFIIDFGEYMQGNGKVKMELTLNSFQTMLQQSIFKGSSKLLSQQEQEYENLIILDFLMWTRYFFNSKDMADFSEVADQIIEEFVDTEKQSNQSYRKSLAIRYLKTIDAHQNKWKSDARNVVQFLVNLSEKSQSLQIILECYNKMIYLLHSYEENQSPLRISAENQEFSSNIEQDKEKEKQESQFNIEFQLEQASIHISKLIKLCHKLYLKLSKMSKKKHSHEDFHSGRYRNQSRMITAINNIMGIAHNIGFQNQESISEYPLFAILGQIRQSLLIGNGQQKYLYIQAQMKFLFNCKLRQEIYEKIEQLIKKQDTQEEFETKTCNEKDLLCLINLFIKKQLIKKHTLCGSQKLHEIIYCIQNLKLIHPHKKLIRQLSGHIWNRSSMSESSILNYTGSLLPLTHAALLSRNNKIFSTVQQQIPFQESSSQLFHMLLNRVLSGILECLLKNQQISEFRSVLKLSEIFAIKSRNFKLLLLTLECLLIKRQDKNININIFLICDSLKTILKQLYGKYFDSAKFDKWCNQYLNNSRQARKSGIFHIKPEQICESLSQTLAKCGYAGYKIYNILINEVSKKTHISKFNKFYYSILLKPEKLLSQMDLTTFKLIKQFKNQQLSNSTLKNLQFSILEQVRKNIKFGYQYCSILQSLLGQFGGVVENYRLSDQTILQMSVLMLDHNYTFKKMIEQVTAASQNKNISENFYEIMRLSNIIVEKYSEQYLHEHFRKMELLKSNQLKFPLTIIYPIGQKLYNIAVKQPLIIIEYGRLQFEDYTSTIFSLLEKNKAVLNIKKIQAAEWWKNRDRFNRQIGKIMNELDVRVWDLSIPPEEHLRGINPKLYKIMMGIKSNSYASKIVSQNLINAINQRYESQFGRLLDEKKIDEIIEESKRMNSFEIQTHSQNLLLLLPSKYSGIPFQTTKYLSRERAVYRLPSISYLYNHQTVNIYRILKIRQVSYLINSSNDLPETQESFLKIKQNFPHWKGIIGRKPTLTQILALFSSDLFLFMGHGVSTSHISEKQFYGKSINCSMMVFGCSSVAMTQNQCEYNGITYSHLINGCPSLLGCLWQVTDRDTDKLTEKLFRSILQGPQNISKLLGICRKRCRHEYLNGGAIVIYGLPTYYYCE